MIGIFLSLFSLYYVPKGVSNSYCDIKGNVVNPGVYLVEKGEVINDIIEKAGGLKKNSYVKNINLSKKVTDEMVIYILSMDEYEELTYVCPVCECEEIEVNCEKEETTTTTTTTTLKTTTKALEVPTSPIEEVIIVNINTASLEELMTLKGIGESIALNIIEYRREHTFESVDDLKKVKGIGDKLFEKIRDYITV